MMMVPNPIEGLISLVIVPLVLGQLLPERRPGAWLTPGPDAIRRVMHRRRNSRSATAAWQPGTVADYRAVARWIGRAVLILVAALCAHLLFSQSASADVGGRDDFTHSVPVTLPAFTGWSHA